MSIHHARRVALGVIAVVALTLGAACTPAQIAAYRSMAPADQAKVDQALREQQFYRGWDEELRRRWYQGVLDGRRAARPTRSGGCYDALYAIFPPSAHAWGRGIIARESGGNPGAQNPRSSAAGCWQTLAIHAPRYQKLGYSWHRDRYNAWANTRVAYDLYREVGTSPWRL